MAITRSREFILAEDFAVGCSATLKLIVVITGGAFVIVAGWGRSPGSETRQSDESYAKNFLHVFRLGELRR